MKQTCRCTHCQAARAESNTSASDAASCVECVFSEDAAGRLGWGCASEDAYGKSTNWHNRGVDTNLVVGEAALGNATMRGGFRTMQRRLATFDWQDQCWKEPNGHCCCLQPAAGCGGTEGLWIGSRTTADHDTRRLKRWRVLSVAVAKTVMQAEGGSQGGETPQWLRDQWSRWQELFWAAWWKRDHLSPRNTVAEGEPTPHPPSRFVSASVGQPASEARERHGAVSRDDPRRAGQPPSERANTTTAVPQRQGSTARLGGNQSRARAVPPSQPARPRAVSPAKPRQTRRRSEATTAEPSHRQRSKERPPQQPQPSSGRTVTLNYTGRKRGRE